MRPRHDHVLLVLLALAALLLLAPVAAANGAASSPAGPRLAPPGGPVSSGGGANAAAPDLSATMTASRMSKLTAASGHGGDLYGTAVAASAGTVFVGAPLQTIGGVPSTGAVYVYTRSGATWSQSQILFPDAAAGPAYFGYSVALQGDTLVVGAPTATVGGIATGAAYVYRNISGVWTLAQTLAPAESLTDWWVGTGVALDGDQLVIGATDAYPVAGTSGAGYVYTRSGGVWTESAELRPSTGSEAFRLGFSAAISGDTALLGSFDANAGSGRLWVFTRSGSTWTNTQLFDGPAGSQFSGRLAMHGDRAFASANSETVNGHDWQGAVHTFTRSGGTWTEGQELTLGTDAAFQNFGVGLALQGDALVATRLFQVTATPEQTWDGEGFVYLFKNGAWERQATTLSWGDGPTTGEPGYTAALGDGVVVLGSPGLDGTVGGVAYVYEVTDTVTSSVTGGHGAVSPSGATPVGLGTTPTFSFTPAAGYAVDTVKLDGTAVDMTGANQYTFAPVYADHALAVSFYNAAGPTTTISGSTYSRKPVKVRFSAVPCVDGLPVASIEYRLGSGKWKTGTKVTVKAWGKTTVRARATDTRGNVGPTRTTTVNVLKPPVVIGYGRPSGTRNGLTSFTFKVKSAAPTVTAFLAITRYHKPVTQYGIGTVPTGKKVTRSIVLGLGSGVWSWRVVVRDPAGSRGLCRWRFLDMRP